MTPDSLIADLSSQDVRLWMWNGQLHFDAPKGVVTEGVLARLRRNKAGILKYLAERTAGGYYADFDNPEIVRQLNERHPDAGEFPEYAAALQLGRLVLCRRCQHYDGPFEKQLGWCRYHKTETAPDVVSTCKQFEQCS